MLTSKKDKLFTAIIENNIAAAEKLLKGIFKVSPNYQQKVTPWIQSGQIKVGEQQNIWEISDISPLHLAVIFNQPKMVKKLVEYGADVNKQIFYTKMTGPNHAVSELLTPLLFSVYEIADATSEIEHTKALEIYCMLRSANARLVGVDDPVDAYFGAGIAQSHIDRHMEIPKFKCAYKKAEEHYHVAIQKSVFVEKLSQRPKRSEQQTKNAVSVQQIKL